MACCFEDRLHYDAPSNGDWGICRLGMLVPEAVELFVGPSACGRHGALGSIHNGYKDRLFFLSLDESDIIEGYAQLIPDAVEEMLANLNKRPRVVMMIFTCLDDLIGTDHDALGEELAERFPDILFRSCHMNPITTDTKLPPMISIQNNIYSFLETERKKDAGVNTIGNYIPLAETCELRMLLRAAGLGPLRHISDYRSFDAYLEMAGSLLNVVPSPLGRQAAERLRVKTGTPYLFLPVSYSLEEVDAQYRQICDALQIDREVADAVLAPARGMAQRKIEEALRLLADMPVIVDDSSSAQPFGLAAALLSYGFRVVRIEAQMCAPFDEGHRAWVEENHPEISHSQPQNDTAVLFDHPMEQALAVGAQAAYFGKTKHIVDLFGDLGMFGYDGICRLMDLMIQAAAEESDLTKILDKMGLVV